MKETCLIARTESAREKYAALINAATGTTVPAPLTVEGFEGGKPTRIYVFRVNSHSATAWQKASELVDRGVNPQLFTVPTMRIVELLTDEADVIQTPAAPNAKVLAVKQEEKQTAATNTDATAPWGRKADGTPKAKPGRRKG